jgi:hypothetical protein
MRPLHQLVAVMLQDPSPSRTQPAADTCSVQPHNDGTGKGCGLELWLWLDSVPRYLWGGNLTYGQWAGGNMGWQGWSFALEAKTPPCALRPTPSFALQLHLTFCAPACRVRIIDNKTIDILFCFFFFLPAFTNFPAK